MIVHVPRHEFAELDDGIGPESAMHVVQGLTENQARHALWCLVILFFGGALGSLPGDVLESAVESIKTSGGAEFEAMGDALVIACQTCVPSSRPFLAAAAKLEVGVR